LPWPFLFIQAHYGPKLVETPLPELVPEEMRNKYIFINADGSSKKNLKANKDRRREIDIRKG
jgi:hypothetical protein